MKKNTPKKTTIRKKGKPVPPPIKPKVNYPLNILINGHMGTGKTQHAIYMSMAIVENRPLNELYLEDPAQVHKRYFSYIQQNRICFVSFHPGLTYREFIENQVVNAQSNPPLEHISDGILKIMASNARQDIINLLVSALPNTPDAIRFNALHSDFIKNIQTEKIYTFEQSGMKYMLYKIDATGDLWVRMENSYKVIPVRKSILRKVYHHYYKKMEAGEAIQKNLPEFPEIEYPEAYQIVCDSMIKYSEQKTVQSISKESEKKESHALSELDITHLPQEIVQASNNYVLIIDHINRQDLEHIFGDVIPLLDADRREGLPGAITVTLPLSKQYFSLPPNFYIVGTQNPSSHFHFHNEVILRKYFHSITIEPNYDILVQSALNKPNLKVKLAPLCETMNNRLRIIKGDNYGFGTQLFVYVKTLEELQQVFDQVCIPSLKGWLDNDMELISRIIGPGFFRKVNEAKELGKSISGSKSSKYNFVILEKEHWTEKTFISIYQ